MHSKNPVLVTDSPKKSSTLSCSEKFSEVGGAINRACVFDVCSRSARFSAASAWMVSRSCWDCTIIAENCACNCCICWASKWFVSSSGVVIVSRRRLTNYKKKTAIVRVCSPFTVMNISLVEQLLIFNSRKRERALGACWTFDSEPDHGFRDSALRPCRYKESRAKKIF